VVAVLVWMLIVAGCGGGDDSGPPSAAVDGADLDVALQLGAAGASIPAVVTVTNNADQPVTIVRPDISPNFVYFEIRDAAGDPLPFDGPWLSLRPREADDVVELRPGESAEQEFDLTRWYSPAPGTYTVTAEYSYDGTGGEAASDAVVVAGVVSPAVGLEVG
jgi:hypothetical protein